MKFRIKITILLLMIVTILIPTTILKGEAKKTGLITAFEWVNPFIGTDEMGHCYPGATLPFGMVQLSPDTGSVPMYIDGKYNKKVYSYCAGYQYKDKTIVGFPHTHFSGTGHSDLGDFLIMPTVGKIQLNPGNEEEPESGYRSRFSHKNESAEPGYYKVRLDDYNIDVQLTATRRVGFHKYTYPENKEANIILDLVHGIYNYDEKVIWSMIRKENNTLITGYRQTQGWGQTRFLYFAMEFSKPIESFRILNEKKLKYQGFWGRHWDLNKENFPERGGKKLKAYFRFNTDKSRDVKVKFAISGVSTAGALNNLREEIPHWDFNRIRKDAKKEWDKELNKIKITAPEKNMEIFYTSLYHSLIGTVIYQDVDGKYMGLDRNVHKENNHINYTSFSLWDTYRALHPLYVLLQPKRDSDMIKSMLAHYDQSVHKVLPIWSFQANENWCMIGYHAVPVIVDAYVKGIRGFNIEKAFEAVVASATKKNYSGLGLYMKLGYVPLDSKFGSTGASKTLEYAYDDWTIYKFAKELNKSTIAETFRSRALNYKNLFDKKIGFIRPKNMDGTWKKNFDPLSTHGEGFIEGNAWNYSLHIPQDVAGYIKLYGGKKKFIEMLDKLFSQKMPESAYAGSEDVEKSGIIGTYVHGNEPSHHIPYLYNWTGAPWKTQEKVKYIAENMYSTKADGICGNDDCGQMSAWYIFSSFGFYPVCPGSDQYIIGTPLIDSCEIDLENGNKFKIFARNRSDKNFYIQSVKLNGKKFNRTYLKHKEIVSGGILEFKMGPEINKKWGTGEMPYSLSDN